MQRSRFTPCLVLCSALAFGCADEAAPSPEPESPSQQAPEQSPDAARPDAARAAESPPSPLELAELFESVWGETDPATRAGTLDRIFVPEGQVVEETVTHDGLDAIKAVVDGFDRTAYDHCAVASAPLVVEDFLRFDATCFGLGSVADGDFTKYGHLAADGRLDLIVIFPDPIARVVFSADLDTTVAISERLASAWTEPDAAAREALLRDSLIEDSFFLSTGGRDVGIPAISEHIAQNLASAAGAQWDRLEVIGGPQEQQGYLRTGLRAFNRDGSLALTGETLSLLQGPDKLAYVVYFDGVQSAGTADLDAGAP